MAERIALTDQQREAVEHTSNVVVSAGPGSGKTRTLVARAAWALRNVSPFRGVACLTYTTDAANEIGDRLARFDVGNRHRITSSTLHSFCLNRVLRPYGPLLGEWVPSGPGQVIDDVSAEILLQRCLDAEGVFESASWRRPTITKIRRALVCGESLGSFDPREVQAADRFEKALVENEAIDFEAMVYRALSLVKRSAAVRDLLVAKYPHILVDEYQDMGGPLHQLIIELYEKSGAVVFAVGDTDQTMFAFAGADAKYLQDLVSRGQDFRHVKLDVNFRSGHDIVAVADALMASANPTQVADGSSSGAVHFCPLEGGFDAHALETIRAIRARSSEVALDRIAVLYPQRGYLLDRLLANFANSGVPFFHEKSELLPSGELSRFVQGVASLAVAMSTIRLQGLGPEFLKEQSVPDVGHLTRLYNQLRGDSSLGKLDSRFEAGRRIVKLTDFESLESPQLKAGPWLEEVSEILELERIAERHSDRSNRNSISVLRRVCTDYDLTVQDLASQVAVLGKVVVTTYHSSKGREFDTVILPGLVNGVVPREVKDGASWRRPNEAESLEQRRAFYVALTRAESCLFLITGKTYEAKRGFSFNKGPSTFLVDLYRNYKARLEAKEVGPVAES